MKKLMLLELSVIVSILVCTGFTKPAFSPGSIENNTTANSTGRTEPSTTETTEPGPTWNTYPADS